MDYSKISKQDIIDMVWDRLNDGTGRAMSNAGGCSYLSDDGLKCAVGIFLPDGNPIQEFGNYVSILIYSHRASALSVEPWYDFLVDHEQLLSEMQYIHDAERHWTNHTIFNEYGKEKFKRICEKFSLKYPGYNQE